MPCQHGDKYAKASEEELMLWFYGCDDVAFEELRWCRLGDWMRKFVHSHLGDRREDAEDVVEEVVFKIFQTKHRPSSRYDPQKASLRAWVGQIILHEIANLFRREDPTVSLSSGDEESGESELPEVPEHLLATEHDEEEKFLVRDAVEKLSEPSRTIVRLCFWEDLTQEEIAQKLGTSVATVNRRLNHDLKCLRDLLGE